MVPWRTLRTRTQRRLSVLTRTIMVGIVGVAVGCIEPPDRGASAKSKAEAEAEPAPTGEKRTATIPAEGWNDDIAWRGLDEGLAESTRTGMPVMMVVHTAWCGNCQKLKTTFNSDASLAALSERFVMVHLDQDAHPEAVRYGPDGSYIPRVMFLDQGGEVDQDLQNPNRPTRFRYFYTPKEDLVATMRRALERHGNKS